MSFVFSWDKLDDDVAQQLQEMIHNHFQRIPKPNFIGSLTVTNFRLGTTPPSVTVLDITDPLEEWYLDMDREEDRLAKEAAEAGGGESMDEEEMVSDEYGDDDDDDDDGDGDHSIRGRGFYYESQHGRGGAGGRQRRGRKYSLTDEEGLVMVGEGEVIEFLDSDGFDHEQDQPYDNDDESPERPWKSKRASAAPMAAVGDKPYRISRPGHGFMEAGNGGEEDHMRPDFFRSAIASPTDASPASSSDSSFGVSGAAARRTSASLNATNSTSTKKQPLQPLWGNVNSSSARQEESGTVASNLSMSPHSSDDEIESQALYTQGESTIYHQLRKLHINSTPSVLEGIQSPEDLDSPDGGLPFSIEPIPSTTTATTRTTGEDGSSSLGATRLSCSPLLSPSGSTPSLGSIGGVVGVGAFQSRTSRTFSMSSAASATGFNHTASTPDTEPPTSPLPAALLNHHDYHQGFGSGNSLLGLGRKQLGVGAVYSPRSGGATPVGFESPIASLSRRPSDSDVNGDTETTGNGSGGQEASNPGRIFGTPAEAHPAVFNPVSQQNLDVHQRLHHHQQRSPSNKPGTRSTPASVFASKDSPSSSSSSASGLLDLPSASAESSATTTKTARRRTGTGLWSAISPSLSGLGKTLSSRANSATSTDSRQSGSQQDGKEKPSLALRADYLAEDESRRSDQRTRAQQQQQQQQRQQYSQNSGGSERGTLGTAGNEYAPNLPRNPQKPRSSQKSSSSVSGWDGEGGGSPYNRFGDGYIVENGEENGEYHGHHLNRSSKTLSRQSKDQRGHDQQQQRQRRRRRRRREQSPSPVLSPIFPGSSKRHENDLQFMLNVQYQGQMGFTIETELLLNYPTFAFLALPIKLTITSFSFKAVLKNVTKVEHFVVDQLRKFIMEDFVYPSYHSVQLLRPQPEPQQQPQQSQQQQPRQPVSEQPMDPDDSHQDNARRPCQRAASTTPSPSLSSRTPSHSSSSIIPPSSTIPSASTATDINAAYTSSTMDYGLHRRHRA
ncbi:Mitochondrial distribution and morphology protein 12 [Actinomortierella ambigua]|uniref:Mitochondrial distribution and morphology protein 12 n=1 Tax=Actinomortierella ambigua TaxID=1343610 RepID=A0A9P6Q0X0_9FUNG|nr:Mitochondrial distribution and morphology protein 12 [Actinomortierella ambigua]